MYSKEKKNIEKQTRARYPMNLKSQAILLRRQHLKPKAIHPGFLKQKGLNIPVPTLSTWYNPKKKTSN